MRDNYQLVVKLPILSFNPMGVYIYFFKKIPYGTYPI